MKRLFASVAIAVMLLSPAPAGAAKTFIRGASADEFFQRFSAAAKASEWTLVSETSQTQIYETPRSAEMDALLAGKNAKYGIFVYAVESSRGVDVDIDRGFYTPSTGQLSLLPRGRDAGDAMLQGVLDVLRAELLASHEKKGGK